MADHKQANIYKQLCSQADAVLKNKPKQKSLPQGWSAATQRWDKKTNFKAVAYQNGNEIVIAFVGTDAKSIKDHGANLKMINGVSAQMKMANEFYYEIKLKYPGANITLAGHSQGGTEATYVATKNNVKAVTFNTFGLDNDLVDKTKNYNDLITNYRDPHDLVSKLKKNPGTTYIVDSPRNKFMRIIIFCIRQVHNINTMGDCETAVCITEK